MAIFEDREKGFEQKYKHDQELEFKIKVRANKLLGLWAAEKMGLSGPAADAYAKEVVVADFKSRGVAMTEHRLRLRMAETLTAARQQVMTEKA